MNNKIIQFICPDQTGIISKITSLLYKTKNNILSIEQHVDSQNNNFYIRIVTNSDNYENFPNKELNKLSKELNGIINIFNSNKKINVAILGTRESEPIYDLFIKHTSNSLPCNIPILISNHGELSYIANQFNSSFYKINSNDELLKILKKQEIDLMILARYMQIIPKNIVEIFKNNIINIHHGFLPAFKGAKPYHQAYKKGVKIIGATAHYVTNKLDEGPIIAQDIVNINHTHSIKDIIQLGRQIERTVLYKAVKSHLEHKIIINNNKTIIFK
tara:strand:+ start:187 stop:1005 length:819 start_codon:yes stop_codon:yes gene_type:complete